MLFFPTSAAAFIVISRRLRRDQDWRGLAPYTLATGLVAMVGVISMGALVLPDHAALHPWLGLVQRALVLAVLFPCRIVLGARLLRQAGR